MKESTCKLSYCGRSDSERKKRLCMISPSVQAQFMYMFLFYPLLTICVCMSSEPNSALLQPPSLELIYRVVVPKMASKWHRVGVLCGVSVEVLSVIREDASDTTSRCSQMFESWLEKAPGTGNRPRTWSTLLEAVQSGYGAATSESIEAELRSWKPEGEGPAGTTRDKVSMHWSERWCRRGTWANCGIEISSHLAPL